MAHELMHAFDRDGRIYNKNGILKQWWTSDSEAEFDRKASFIRKQYSNYTLFDIAVSYTYIKLIL